MIPSCCFFICLGCCRACCRPPHTHTYFCQLSQRNLSSEKCPRWLLQPFSFNQQAKSDRLSLLPLAYAVPTAPATPEEVWDFQSTYRLCPPPQLVSTICVARPGAENRPEIRSWNGKKVMFVQCTAVKIHSLKLSWSFFESFLWAEMWSSPWASTITPAWISCCYNSTFVFNSWSNTINPITSLKDTDFFKGFQKAFSKKCCPAIWRHFLLLVEEKPF